MPAKHIILRSRFYHFVCRVPHDLSQYFPLPIISRALHTDSKKYATVLGAAWEHRTQKLFMQLRSDMLDTHLIEHLINQYLQAGINKLEADVYGREYQRGEITTSLDFPHAYADVMPSPEQRARRMQLRLKYKDTSAANGLAKSTFAPLALERYGKKLMTAEVSELAIRLVHAEKQLADVENAVLDGRFDTLELLKGKVNNAREYVDLKTLIGKYKDKYLVDNINMSARATKHLNTELDVILEIFDNASIDVVNSGDGISLCKGVLRQFPKNMTQRFNKRPSGWIEGDKPYKRSVHQIIAQENDYEIIVPHTANSYIKRLKGLIDYAIKYVDYDKPNRWSGELLADEEAEGRQRRPYDQEDINRLMDALCTQPLWRYDIEKPERFWLVLIALLQGFRLGSITALTQGDILILEGVLGFQIRVGKTRNTRKFYPMNDCLVLLGFVDWSTGLDRDKLFQDSSDQASKWYNRVDRDKDGNITWAGFEYFHVTQDSRKCLHSMRHSYGGKVYEISDDIKATADAMGHAMVAGKVTNRYIGEAGLPARKALIDKLNFNLDLDRLEVRAKELFNL